MTLYTQKFIATDYLARVQTQTHFFLRPLVRRVAWGGKRRYEWREPLSERERGEREREFNIGRNKIETRVSWGRYSERESGKLRRWARVVELSACFLPCTRPRPHVRESPSLNLAETRGFPQQRRASLFIVG